MALIKCPECSLEVSERALACPKCAFPISEAQDSVNNNFTPNNNKKRKGTIIQSFIRLGLVVSIAIFIIGLVVFLVHPFRSVSDAIVPSLIYAIIVFIASFVLGLIVSGFNRIFNFVFFLDKYDADGD